MLNINGKIICIDWSVFLKMGTYASVKAQLPPTYISLSMILGNLKKIGLEEKDTIFICCDYMGSWRKDYITTSKADRAEKESKFQDDFPNIYKKFDNLLTQLDNATDWHILKYPKIEADDWMAYVSKLYKDNEVILLTMDSDLELCWHYENVKIFSPHRKCKKYKIKPNKFNSSKVLAKMITTAGHNNLGVPKTEEEYETKKLCVNLLELPEWIESKAKEKINELQLKGIDIDSFPPYTKLKDRYEKIYRDKKGIITYEQCIKQQERKKNKKKKLNGRKK